MPSDGAKLTVGAHLWIGEDDHEDHLLETERTDTDEVRLSIEDATIYFSRAAASEIGYQLIARCAEKF